MAENSARGARVTEPMALTQRASQRDKQMPRSVDSAIPSNRALSRTRRHRESFVATLAHELRQPLSTLQSAIELIRLDPQSAATARVIAIMERQVSQMTRVVEDLLDAVRWARGKVAVRKERFDLRELIHDATADVAATLAARGQSLVIATGPEALWVNADPQRLHQVLSNLLCNAVKYTDAGGCISIAAEAGPLTITLRVRDTGCGIAADALADIFQLFSQVRPSGAAGVGIGLSVVREIVMLHDGRIEARSAGPGQGSEFIVTLPLAPPPPSS
jgi:signal transduction histidine kinase